MLQILFNIYGQILWGIVGFFEKHQLLLLCLLGIGGVVIYTYGCRVFSRLRARQREEMRLHPEEPAPELPEKPRRKAIILQVGGFSVLLLSCLAMLLLGHFNRYLALFGIGR